MEKRYRTSAHTKHRLVFHIVFRPKYRKRVLRYNLAKRAKELFKQCCCVNDWIIHEIEIMPNHVHILIQINPRDSIAYVMQLLKGGSSKVIRDEFPELEEFLWGDSFWSEEYFVESIGKVAENAVRKYISQQNKQLNRDHGL